MNNNLYNRQSCRSPMPMKYKVNTINPPTNINKLYDKQSCRSVKKIVPKEDVYKVVTENAVGKEVVVPDMDNKYSFIKYTKKPSLFNIQSNNKINYIIYNARKKYPYNQALDIYENNQSYFLNKIEKYDNNKSQSKYIKDAEKLERWFRKIIEPKPIIEEDVSEWENRNEFNKIHNYSSYCDKELLKYMNL